MIGEPVSLDKFSLLMRYLEWGWHIFPLHGVVDGLCTCGDKTCGRAGKHPRTQNGHKDATSDRVKLTDWVSKYSHCNWAVSLEASGLVVIDVDPRNNGDEGFAELVREVGKIPETLTNLTGGGGQHYFFTMPPGASRPKNYVPKQGVDVKASGYMVLPPSTHVVGTYRWDSGQAEKPVVAPQWLVLRKQSKANKTYEDSGIMPAEGVLGAAFLMAGLIVADAGPGKAIVLCPWRDEHTSDTDGKSSTVVFAPSAGQKFGWFHCSHSHCIQRFNGLTPQQRLQRVLEVLPPDAVAKARANVPGADTAVARLVRLPWEESLQWDPKAERLLPVAGNLALLLSNSEQWKGAVVYDEAKDRMIWGRNAPELTGLVSPKQGELWADGHWIHVAHWMLTNRRVEFRREIVEASVYNQALGTPFNSLHAYLNSLHWDQTERLSTWLSHYCGAPDNEYTRFVGRAWMISAIARAFEPGCQADHMLVLEGGQGIGKTSVFRILGGEWYLGRLANLRDKDALLGLSGNWIVEFQELEALRGTEINLLKAFLTERLDKFRMPYGRAFVDRPRRCVFAGTTNDSDYLEDPTGARRFWPTSLPYVRLEELARDRDQLWAEAFFLYHQGELWYPEHKVITPDLKSAIAREQEYRQSVDPWEPMIEGYLSHQFAIHGTMARVTTVELLGTLQVSPDKMTRRDSLRAGKIVRRLGWHYTTSRDGGKLYKCWMPNSEPEEKAG